MFDVVLQPPPAKTPCATCPFRLANVGKPTPAKAKIAELPWFSLENIARMWDGVRDGEVVVCHSRDPGQVEGITLDKPDATCAGAHIVVMREMQRLQTIMQAPGAPKGMKAISAYIRSGPARLRLTRDGVFRLIERATFGKLPPVDDDPEIGVPERLPSPAKIRAAQQRAWGRHERAVLGEVETPASGTIADVELQVSWDDDDRLHVDQVEWVGFDPGGNDQPREGDLQAFLQATGLCEDDVMERVMDQLQADRERYEEDQASRPRRRLTW